MLYFFIRFLAWCLLNGLFRLQVFGRKNIPLKGGFILASNHISYLDPLVLGVAPSRVISFLGKEKLFTNRKFGWFMRGLKSIPVKNNPRDLQTLRYSIRKLKSGHAIGIFPEGARVTEGKAAPVLKGVGFLAAHAKVPILPAFIKGTNKALPVNSRRIYLEKIKVYFGEPLLPESWHINECRDKDALYQDIAEKTMREINRLKELYGN